MKTLSEELFFAAVMTDLRLLVILKLTLSYRNKTAQKMMLVNLETAVIQPSNRPD